MKPTFVATALCENPAKRPAIIPNSPAIGAIVVENRAVNMAGVPEGLYLLKILAMRTPSIIGSIFLGCFPKTLKPITVSIPPNIGPFMTPPQNLTNNMQIIPVIPTLKITKYLLNKIVKSLISLPLWLSNFP